MMTMILVLAVVAAGALAVAVILVRVVTENRTEVLSLLLSWPDWVFVLALSAYAYARRQSLDAAVLLFLLPLVTVQWVWVRSLRSKRGTGERTEGIPGGSANPDRGDWVGRDVTAAFHRRRTCFVWLGLFPFALGGLLLLTAGDADPTSPWLPMAAGIGAVAFVESLLTTFFVYRCPACSQVPDRILSEPVSCQRCGARLS